MGWPAQQLQHQTRSEALLKARQDGRMAFRFAPSPNGHLHLGHARSALIGHALAVSTGGRFLVRIEDIDTARCKPEYTVSILDDLAWLGLDWETPVRQQSQHFRDYQASTQRLLADGLLYPCYASRAEILKSSDPRRTDPDGVPFYPGRHGCISAAESARRRQRGEPFALRIDMARALAACNAALAGQALTFTELDAGHGHIGSALEAAPGRVLNANPERWGDALIVRKDTPTSYHLSVVIDDALQGITHVTRGRDLFTATGLQRLLQVLLGLPEPLYHHHSLILGQDGRKLSKSTGAPSLKSLRMQGLSATEVRRRCLL
jgi:glutamyl-Q tRNA(Asp) synthetase